MQTFGYIPEARKTKIQGYIDAEGKLKERLNRHPTAGEMADEMSLPLKEIGRMRKEMRGELADSAVAEDKRESIHQYGPQNPDGFARVAMDYVYPELDDREKLVFEHTFGYGGGEMLKTNRDIAKKAKMSEGQVRKTKQKIADKTGPFLQR